MRKPRDTFSPEFKMQVILELFNTQTSVTQLAQKYEISTKNITNWKQQFIKNSHTSFDSNTLKSRIEKLKKENSRLEKILLKLQLEKNEAVMKLKNLDISIKKQIIDTSSSQLSIAQQCKIIDLNRPSLYYVPRETKKNDELIMQRIYEIFQTQKVAYGYRSMHQELIKEGYKIGVNKVHKLIKLVEETKDIKQSSKHMDAANELIQHSHILHDLELAKPCN